MQTFSSVAQSCRTLCDPMDCSTPDLPVLHQLLEFAQTHVHWVVMPSNHLILCHLHHGNWQTQIRVRFDVLSTSFFARFKKVMEEIIMQMKLKNALRLVMTWKDLNLVALIRTKVRHSWTDDISDLMIMNVLGKEKIEMQFHLWNHGLITSISWI